jgi:hypothetical protein
MVFGLEDVMTLFAVGLFVGAFLGMLIMGLLASAKR